MSNQLNGPKKFPVLLTLLLVCFSLISAAQTKVVRGIIKDQHSDESIPFASIQFKKSGIGQLADSSGAFLFHFYKLPVDTLIITNVGYADYKLSVNRSSATGDTLNLIIRMEPGKYNTGVVVKAKGNRGLMMWKRIVKHKPYNDPYRFNNFSYELYNKLELDLKNINKEKLAGMKVLRPFHFILNNVDTTGGTPFLPVYLTEAISDYYYQKSPKKRREVFKGVKTLGVENESVAKMLGGMDQVVNVYNNFIPVFDKSFVSPISNNGDAYYTYKVADTQYVAGHRLIHFLFTSKRKGENTFEGDCWVQDTTFAIQKMNLRLSKDANINYVDKISLIQEFQLINDSTWFLAKDKFVADISLFGKTNVSFTGRKTTTYHNIKLNDTAVINEVSKNKVLEESIVPTQAIHQDDQYWTQSRHEPLSKGEQATYDMIDTLTKMPLFQRYNNTLSFIGGGYANVGNYMIGPWQNWMYSDVQEGLRLRFDLTTNHHFSQKILLHGYAAYGFGDKKWKGEADAFYLFNKNPRTYVFGSFFNDFDYGQNYFDEISSDNILALAVRKRGVPIKYIRLKEEQLEFYKEWNPGISLQLSTHRKQYDPVRNLPDKFYFTSFNGETFNTFETAVRIRFAYLEKFLENSFYRTSLGSPLPIVELKYTKGISGIFNSSYDYHRISASVSDYRAIAPFGSIYYNVFAGQTFGTLPYMLLDVAPGNEIYYYNKYAFNMMNRYEYVHDKYAGINLEHNFGNGLFRFIPLTRKLKFRQFWTAKALWGSLSPENQALNLKNNFPFQALNGRTYLELGTGVDNIFKVLRVDFIWRPLPSSHSEINNQRFGVFGSLRLSF